MENFNVARSYEFCEQKHLEESAKGYNHKEAEQKVNNNKVGKKLNKIKPHFTSQDVLPEISCKFWE
jgi:hypothetical protein